MLPVDLERFWQDNDAAAADPFSHAIPQPPLSLWMSDAVYDELGLDYDPLRFERDADFANRVSKAYNDRAQSIVGRRLLPENRDPRQALPRKRDVAELFGCRREFHAGSWWHMPAAGTPDELARLLDGMDAMTGSRLAEAIFPADWDAECRRMERQFGLRLGHAFDLRGPVTLATSIYGPENLIFLILDDASLASRFRDTIARVVIEYHRLCAAAADPAKVRPGFSFRDDNCALLNGDMYAFFGQPIVEAVFTEFAPGPDDWRYQHSDSDMGHLLPLLAATGLNRVNFGPTLSVRQIRDAMPRAVIEGQLAPFTFMGNDEQAIIAQVRRDIDQARETRGLVVATAGSVNNGTKLTSYRAVMHAIQTYGRY